MTKPVGIEKLTPNNHTLFRRMAHLIRMGKTWEEIAEDVGIYHVNDLCEWYVAYKSPPEDIFRHRQSINVIPVKAVRVTPKPDPKKMTDQFLSWKRAREGAKVALSDF